MQYKYFLNIFLLCSSAMSAMELTTTNNSVHIHNFADDLFTTKICSQLDRPARDALRRTCTKYFKIVLSQDELNAHYKEAVDKKDSSQMDHWASLGGCLFYQEFAQTVKNKKNKLAAWLLLKEKVSVWDAYCLNIRQAVETLTVDEMLPVIKWLLYTRKPVTHHNEFLSGYHFSNNLKEKYPEIQKIIDLFKKYEEEYLLKKDEEKYEEEIRRKSEVAVQALMRIPGFGSGPWRSFGNGLWHSRGDYY